MSKVWQFLVGKKTYILAFAASIYATGIATGLWPHSAVVDLFLGSGTVATLRHAIDTTQTPTPNA